MDALASGRPRLHRMTHEKPDGVTTRNTTLIESRGLTPPIAPGRMDSFSLPLAAWAAWPTHAPGCAAPTDSPPPPGAVDIAFVDPMLRRRLGPVARMALNVAHRCLGERTGVPMVFASRHGELARTLAMLHDLAAGEEVSPAAFSLSVHNAAAGVFSIARHDTAPATAIAAGDETLGMALVEARARLSEAHPQLLLVCADAPAPELYQDDITTTESAHALALLFDLHQSRRLHVARHASSGTPSNSMMSLPLADLLAGHRPDAAWSGTHARWEWTLDDA